MGEVVPLPLTESDTAHQRARFEAWITRALRKDEAVALLSRSRGGDYVLGSARAAWAAWQARGVCDAMDKKTDV